MGALTVEEIVHPGALDTLAGEWRALFEAAADASPFQSPAWLLAWRRAFLSDGLWTLTARDEGRLAGLLPMFVYRRPEDGCRQLTLLGNGVSDRLDLLAEPGREAEVAAVFLQHMAKSEAHFDAADFRDMPRASPLAELALPAGFEAIIEDEEPCPVRPLPASPEAVVASLPRKRRENIGRRRRRLMEQGRLETETATPATREALLADLLRLHGRRWESRGEAGVLADAAVQAFHAAATQALLADGLLQLQALRLEGRVIAAHYGLRRGGRAYSYIHGFDPDYAAFAPSTLLVVEAMEEAVRRGADSFDFLRGREGYKYDLGGEDQPQVRRRFRRPGAAG